jgi:hypothetical protein
MGTAVLCSGAVRAVDGDTNDRPRPREGAPVGLRRKRGEQTQAIARSRGGRNTKIHAIVDAKGRPLSLMLTDGAAHDCPAAKPLIEDKQTGEEAVG